MQKLRIHEHDLPKNVPARVSNSGALGNSQPPEPLRQNVEETINLEIW